MKTAVIYARYSSDSQSEQSIEGQIHVCKDYAEKNGIVVVDTYIDRAMTGKMITELLFKRRWKTATIINFPSCLFTNLIDLVETNMKVLFTRKHLKTMELV